MTARIIQSFINAVSLYKSRTKQKPLERFGQANRNGVATLLLEPQHPIRIRSECRTVSNYFSPNRAQKN